MIKRDSKGRFVKGNQARLGLRLSEEIKRKISESHKGKFASALTKRKMRIAHIGRKYHPHTEETKQKISNAKKDYKYSKETIKKRVETRKKRYTGWHSEETIEKIREGNKGKKRTEETKRKVRKARTKQILPVKDTTIEIKIQNFLKQLGIEFFTHQYMKEIKHGYQCDILIPSMNLVIECDGNYWHKYPIGNDLDHIRTKELIEKGFKVLRLWEFEIKDMELNQFKNKLK